MNTIICLVVCNVFAACFFATPWVLARREMKKWSPAPTRNERFWFELLVVACVALSLAVAVPLLADLAEGYAALYVDQVGWWTL